MKEVLGRFTAAKKFDFRENRYLSANGWRTLLQALSPGVEELSFCYCSLDDDKANGLKEVLGTAARKFDFCGNSALSANRWKTLLQALSPGVEEFSFRCCDLNGDNANVLKEVLGRFTAAKKLNFSRNPGLSASVRNELQLCSSTVEVLSIEVARE